MCVCKAVQQLSMSQFTLQKMLQTHSYLKSTNTKCCSMYEATHCSSTHFGITFFQNLKTADECFVAKIVFRSEAIVCVEWHINHDNVAGFGVVGGGFWQEQQSACSH